MLDRAHCMSPVRIMGTTMSMADYGSPLMVATVPEASSFFFPLRSLGALVPRLVLPFFFFLGGGSSCSVEGFCVGGRASYWVGVVGPPSSDSGACW